MSEYIKREDAKHLFLNHLGNRFPLSFKEQIVEKAFEELPPSADVVEVVRCKDCKGYTPADETYGTCYAYKGVYGKIKPTDYCSYGERGDVK